MGVLHRVAGLTAVLALGGIVCGQAAGPAGAQTPETTQAAASQAMAGATKTMIFRFEDAAVEDILREVAARLGIIIEKQGMVPGRLSISVPEPVNASQAMDLLNSMLIAVRYAALEVHRDGEERRILRVMPFEQAKKQ